MPPERKELSTTPIYAMLREGIRDPNSANQEVMESGDMHVMGPVMFSLFMKIVNG